MRPGRTSAPRVQFRARPGALWTGARGTRRARHESSILSVSYTHLVTARYFEMLDAMEALEDAELSDGDAAYYLLVSGRISAKLALVE